MVSASFEAYDTISKSKQSMIFTHPNIICSEMSGAALTNNNVSGYYPLPAKYFNSETLTM